MFQAHTSSCAILLGSFAGAMNFKVINRYRFYIPAMFRIDCSHICRCFSTSFSASFTLKVFNNVLKTIRFGTYPPVVKNGFVSRLYILAMAAAIAGLLETPDLHWQIINLVSLFLIKCLMSTSSALVCFFFYASL